MVLATIYPNARLSWYFNGSLFKSFNDTPATLSNTIKFPFASLNMTGVWECKTYELDIKESDDVKGKKGLLGKMKDKVFKSSEDKKKEEEEEKERKKKAGPAILRPLTKYVSTPAPPPKIKDGKIWITNRVRVQILPPKSLADMLRTPQFLGLCVGLAVLAIMIAGGLIKTKAT
ncbi:hypothetical protein RvY_18493-2 [Ramazzottius varieornatus]|uniref:Uncharacterized protein n=1 Tax=Ramazzottius varieornatus TaxID=947166 RepID=A0A1D1WAJ3_RAMVA|nr:hypothetical protein RvY_18493-2 [Ramazzottius varieornatus]